MRKLLTIVALAATCMIAGNAIAQTYDWWGYSMDSTSDFGNLGIIEEADFGLTGGESQTVDNLFLASPTANFNLSASGSGNPTITNLWVNEDSIRNTSSLHGNATVTNFNLAVGERLVVHEQGRIQFGTDVDSVTLTDTSIQVGNTTVSGIAGWTTADTKYKVNNTGTITTLNYNGGVYENAGGTINNLVIGTDISGVGDNYWGNSVATAKFTENGKITLSTADVSMNGGLTDWTGWDVNVTENFDLSGATIDLKLAFGTGGETTFMAWLGESFDLDIAGIFGDSVNAGIVSVTDNNWDSISLNFLWGENDPFAYAVANHEGWSWDGSHIQYTASVTPPPTNPSPEPATLAVLGLGLAGLGVASRRRRK